MANNLTRTSELNKDVLGWDVRNWNKALIFFDQVLNNHEFNLAGKKCLEVGSGFNGGLSLWLAYQGANVLCTGCNEKYTDASDEAKLAHVRHSVDGLIEYGKLDARSINSYREFDVIALKSVLGGVDRSNGYLNVSKNIISQMYNALKPGGVLLIAENLKATKMHEILRGKFASGKNGWRYFSASDFNNLFLEYDFDLKTFGVLGCFGRNEFQRNLLGVFDSFIEPVLPASCHYISAVVVFKK